MDPDTFDDKHARVQMERQLKRLLPSVYQLADARQTRPSARQAIYAQCKQLQRVLEDLLTEYNRRVIHYSCYLIHISPLQHQSTVFFSPFSASYSFVLCCISKVKYIKSVEFRTHGRRDSNSCVEVY